MYGFNVDQIVFGNDGQFHLFPRLKADYLALWASDHRPIKISFSLEGDEQCRGRFYFDKRMIKKEDFEDVLRKGWESHENLEMSSWTKSLCVGGRLQTGKDLLI